MKALLTAVAAATWSVAAMAAPLVITADCSRQVDYPLSKSKFGVYNSGCVALPHYDRDIALFDEVKANSLRIDLWWGGGVWSPQPVAGTADSVSYNFDQMDHIARLLNAHGIQPYWSYCYIPSPLQARAGNTRRVTSNAKLWGTIVGTFARHARAGGPLLKVGYHEIYNEPDNRDFFQSSREDYFGLYREGSRSLRAADPDALIGGPALAFTPAWVGPFLEMVKAEQLPLDFFSFHFYPRCWGTNSIREVVRQMRQELAKHPELATTEMHLNEFNSFPIDYPKGGRQDRHTLAAALLEDYEWFVSQPDLAQVNWAQFQDTGGGNWSGMLSIEGHRKAVFNAAAIYARMPVDRCQVSVRGSGDIGTMASADEHRAGLVIWNRSGTNQPLRAKLKNVPFTHGSLRVYRIDAGHASWGDNPANQQLTAVETRTEVPTGTLNWTGVLPGNGVLYFEVQEARGQPEAKPLPSARIVRELHYYPDRESRGYADFDRREWTARLGAGGDAKSHQQVGVVAENLPPVLHVRVRADGKLQRIDQNSLLGLRVDYQVGTNYTRAVIFHGRCERQPDLYDKRRDAPIGWGTRRNADHVISVKNFANFDVAPSAHAPAGWSGRAEITFLLQNAGKGARARMSLNGE